MIKIEFAQDEIKIIEEYARDAQLGGKSNIRTSDRHSMLSCDQLTGQLGEAALSKYISGNIELYKKTRQERNKNKWIGDGGADLIGYNIDIKTSVARRGINFFYHLWIREREYNQSTLYILAIVPENEKCVYLLGWCYGRDITIKKGDRYEVCVNRMRSIDTLQFYIASAIY